MALSPKVAPVSIPQLRVKFNGRVIAPGDADYHEARSVFVGGVDRRPAAIIHPADASEVARVITVAQETGMELAVRSGGHSIARHGVCDGGVVLDLSDMRALNIDVERRSAWAQTGLTAGEYTTAAAAYGLATGFGDTGSVGIGGLTLGGGVGYLARKHGLTIDSLLAAEIVTADGKVLHVDVDNHPDLFWAIRGGGGNFGVVTRFQFRLHEIGTVVGGMLMLPATPKLIHSFVAEAESAPNELTTMADVMLAPPLPFVPAEHHGRPVIMVRLCYAGETDAGRSVIAPFRALATPIVDMVRPMPYPRIYQDAEYEQPLVTLRTMFVDTVDRDVPEMIIERLHASTAPIASTELRVLGGAIDQVPAGATAYAHRGRGILATVGAVYQQPDEAAEHESWVTDVAAALSNGGSGAYVNFLGDEDEARIREAYPGPTWNRLVAIKGRYDPNNFFRLNHNVPPRGR